MQHKHAESVRQLVKLYSLSEVLAVLVETAKDMGMSGTAALIMDAWSSAEYTEYVNSHSDESANLRE